MILKAVGPFAPYVLIQQVLLRTYCVPIMRVKMACELRRQRYMELPSKQETGMIKGTQIDIKGSCDNSLRKRSLVL